MYVYVVAGLAKFRFGGGWGWLDGDRLLRLVAHDNLRKRLLGGSYSPIAEHVIGHPSLFRVGVWLTLVVELGAPVALLGASVAILRQDWLWRGLGWALAGLALSQGLAAWLGQGAYYLLLALGAFIAYDSIRQVVGQGTSTLRPRTPAEKGVIARQLEAEVWPLLAFLLAAGAIALIALIAGLEINIHRLRSRILAIFTVGMLTIAIMYVTLGAVFILIALPWLPILPYATHLERLAVPPHLTGQAEAAPAALMDDERGMRPLFERAIAAGTRRSHELA